MHKTVVKSDYTALTWSVTHQPHTAGGGVMESNAGKVVNLLVYRAARSQEGTQHVLPFDVRRRPAIDARKIAHRQRMLEHLSITPTSPRPVGV